MRITRSAAAIALPLLAVAVGVAAGTVVLLSLPGGPAVAPAGACSLDCGGPDNPCLHPVRVDARRVGGRIEVAIREERSIEPSCATIWTGRWLPQRRYAPAPESADSWLIDRWLNSTSLVTIGSEVRVSLRIRGDRSVEYALQQRVFGKWQERRTLAPFLPADATEGEWHESEVLDFIPAYKPGYPTQPQFTLERDKQYAAVLLMEDGSEIEIELFADDAPLTVNWFVFLARDGYYDGLRFDSVMAGSLAYAGRVLNYRHLKIPYEFSGRPNSAGAVGMVPRINPDDYDGEFYIKMTDEGELPADPAYFSAGRFFTDPFFVFGRIVRGLDSVRAFPSVDRVEHEVGPMIRTIRIDERPREIPQPEPGIIPHGLRAGTQFERNLLGDPDAPVLIQRLSPVTLGTCPNCFYSWSYIEPQIFEALIATGIARYEVIPVRPLFAPSYDHALACAADQDKFWELADGLSILDNIRFGYGFSIDDYAAGLGMDAALFRACIDERRNADQVEAWHQQSEAFGLQADYGDAWFVNGILIVTPEHWPAHAEEIIKAARFAAE